MVTKQRNDYSALFDSVNREPDGYTAGDGEYLPAVPLADILPAEKQPRTRFDPKSLKTLAEELKEDGLLQPLVVRPRGRHADGSYPGFEIIAGERRYHAAKLVEIETVKVLVREVSDDRRYELALIENAQREGLNIADECLALAELKRRMNYSERELQRATGLSRGQVKQRLAAAKAPEALLEALATTPDSLVKVANVARIVQPEHVGAFARAIRAGKTEAQINDLLRQYYREPEPEPQPVREDPLRLAPSSHPTPLDTQQGTTPRSSYEPERTAPAAAADTTAELFAVESAPVTEDARRAHEAEVLARPETQEFAASLRPQLTDEQLRDRAARMRGEETVVLQAPTRPSERGLELMQELVRLEAEDASADTLSGLWRQVYELAREQM